MKALLNVVIIFLSQIHTHVSDDILFNFSVMRMMIRPRKTIENEGRVK